MKPLILWARGKYPEPYLLRIGAHDTAKAVSGVVRIDGVWLPFSFRLAAAAADGHQFEIRIGEGESIRVIRINEWGWEQ